MKKLFSFALIGLLCLGIEAGNPNPKINELIRSEITYPDYARKIHEEGVVVVSFRINSEGNICINEVQSNSETLKNHVINKLNHMTIKDNLIENQEYIMRFVFKLY